MSERLRPIVIQQNRFKSILFAIMMITIVVLGYLGYNKLTDQYGDLIILNDQYMELLDENTTNTEDAVQLATDAMADAMDVAEEISVVSGDVDSLNEVVSTNQTQLNTAIEDLNASIASLNESAVTNEMLDDALHKVGLDLDAISSQITDINDRIISQDDIDLLITDIAQMAQTIDGLVSALDNLSQELEDTSERLSMLENPLEIISWSDLYADQEGNLFSYVTIKNNAYYDIRSMSQFFDIVMYFEENDLKLTCELGNDSIFAGSTQVFICRTNLTDSATDTPGNVSIEVKKE